MRTAAGQEYVNCSAYWLRVRAFYGGGKFSDADAQVLLHGVVVLREYRRVLYSVHCCTLK